MRVARWVVVLAVAGGCAEARPGAPRPREPGAATTSHCEARVAAMRARAPRAVAGDPGRAAEIDFSLAVPPPRARRSWRKLDRRYLPVYAGPVTLIGHRSRQGVLAEAQESELAAMLEARQAELEEGAEPPMILVIATSRGWGSAAHAIRVAAAAPVGTTVGLAVRLPEEEVVKSWRRFAPASPGFVVKSVIDLDRAPLQGLRERARGPWTPLSRWSWDVPERDLTGNPVVRLRPRRHLDPHRESPPLSRLFDALEGRCAEATAVRERYLEEAGLDAVLMALADATAACGCRGLAPEALEGLYVLLLRPPPLYGWIPLDDEPQPALFGVDDLVRFAEARGR